MSFLGRLLSDDTWHDSSQGQGMAFVADCWPCCSACHPDGSRPCRYGHLMEDVPMACRPPVGHPFCYRYDERCSHRPFPLAGRQYTKALLDTLWLRPTAPSASHPPHRLLVCHLNRHSYCEDNQKIRMLFG